MLQESREFLTAEVKCLGLSGPDFSCSSIDFLQKGGQQGKKGKKKLFEVPLSSDLDTKDKKLSLKQRKQVNKLVGVTSCVLPINSTSVREALHPRM